MAAAITAVGIVTRDRVSDMVACLESHVESCRRHDRDPEFIVIDDSRGAEAQSQARTALQRTARRWDVRIRYAGTVEKNRFADRLALESAIPGDLVRFALLGDARCGVTVGANRNGLLLDTAGALVFSADDDTLCRAAPAPDRHDAVATSGEYDPTEFSFFPDRAGALESVSFEDIDVLGCHEPLFDGSVAVTLQGLVGDSAMGSPLYFLGLTGPSRERLMSSLEAYQSAFRSREVLRSVRRPTITGGPFFMATFFGFDNRMALPPFFPVQRNEDGVFGLLLQHGLGGRTAFLPWVLVHAPAPRSFAPDTVWTDAGTMRMADIVIDCLRSHPPAPFARLGSHLRRLGFLSPEEFETRIRTGLRQRTIAWITVLQSRLQAYQSAPEFWARDVHRLIDVLMQAPHNEDSIVPRDLPVEAARPLAQELVGKFGELLEAWPVMVEASRRLRTRGVRLSEPCAEVP